MPKSVPSFRKPEEACFFSKVLFARKAPVLVRRKDDANITITANLGGRHRRNWKNFLPARLVPAKSGVIFLGGMIEKVGATIQANST